MRLTEDVMLSTAASLLLARPRLAVIGCLYSERAGGMLARPTAIRPSEQRVSSERASSEENVILDMRSLLEDTDFYLITL